MTRRSRTQHAFAAALAAVLVPAAVPSGAPAAARDLSADYRNIVTACSGDGREIQVGYSYAVPPSVNFEIDFEHILKKAIARVDAADLLGVTVKWDMVFWQEWMKIAPFYEGRPPPQLGLGPVRDGCTPRPR